MMSEPLVSVIIPTYNGASFLGNAIRSVLDQTYPNFELIVVDDKSPDNTEELVNQFDDSRIQYIRHETNQGAASARRTGCRASSGAIIAFLDQDDSFHPEKLQRHAEFLEEHPDVGFTYNPHFEMVHSSDSIRTIWQPPKNISLTELTLGFYIPPSAWVVRREWAFIEDIWDAHASLRGREIVVLGRLFMSGCKFALVDKVLHYRGYHARRNVKNIEQNCKDELACQEIIFSDPRCPEEVSNMRFLANSIINVMWANVAFTQSETELGRKFLQDVIQLNPAGFLGVPSPFMNFVMGYCIDDESYEYETLLGQLFGQLPLQIPNVLPNYLWALSRGSFIRGVRALIWDRQEDADRYFSRAVELKFEMDEESVKQITHELMGYEMCYGSEAAMEMLSKLSSKLESVTGRRSTSWLKGSFFINKARRDASDNGRRVAPATILGAIAGHPKYLFDRGILTALLKSLVGLRPTSGG